MIDMAFSFLGVCARVQRARFELACGISGLRPDAFDHSATAARRERVLPSCLRVQGPPSYC